MIPKLFKKRGNVKMNKKERIKLSVAETALFITAFASCFASVKFGEPQNMFLDAASLTSLIGAAGILYAKDEYKDSYKGKYKDSEPVKAMNHRKNN